MRRFLILFVILLIDRSIDAQQPIDPPVPCAKDQDCSELSKNQKNPTCKGGFCACLDDQQQLRNCSSLQRASQQEKAIVSQIYHRCKLDVDCNANNSFCNISRSQCDCKKGYVPSTKKEQCLEVARGLSFPCTEDKQCLAVQANTTCQNMQCVCINGYHVVDNVCYRNASYNGICARSEECNHINNAYCTDKKICECAKDTKIDNTLTNCIPLAQTIGDYCTSDAHCKKIEDSICVDSKCQCAEGEGKHFAKEITKCIYNRANGEPCEHDYDCYQPRSDTNSTDDYVNPLQCLGSICSCQDDYRTDNEKGICMRAGSPMVVPVLMILSSIVCGGLYLQ
ncbi:hypothetical protein KPH14_002077 [Odynerus spinipes]|uniref:EB domain-containing protein n=1 Tax=Odynerus spinipes TaxID=1348599 RepID=A0AAD9VPR7_9HYME|nr:hypothetical protein KPH14_002077 [Odynerus spinipes]